MKLQVLGYIVVGVLAVGSAGFAGYYTNTAHSKSAIKCVAGPNELCPPEQFSEDVNRLIDLNKDIAKERIDNPDVRKFQDNIDLASGIDKRLGIQLQQQYPDYVFDMSKRVLVKKPVTAPLPVAPVAAPAPKK